MLHAALDLAPHGILIVEEAGVVEADEELAVGAVGVGLRAIDTVPRTCGAFENSALRSGRSDPLVPVPLGSPPCAMKPGNDAVKLHAVVEAAVGKLGDALDVAGREVRAKLDDDVAAGRKVEGQAVGVGHEKLLGAEMERGAI